MATFTKKVLNVRVFTLTTLSYKQNKILRSTETLSNAVCVSYMNLSKMTMSGFTTKHKFSSECQTKCWKCKKQIKLTYGQYMCECGVLQPPSDNMSLFDVMGESDTFDINLDLLSKKFRHLQSKLHPDKFTNKPQQEQEHSQMQSTLVNKAYKTLQDPLLRGLYLLELNGETIEEDNKEIDQGFLMEIMELNEELADIDCSEKYQTVLSKNEGTLEELFKKLSDAFQAGDIFLAKKILIKLKYYTNLQEKLREQKHLYEY